MKPFSDKRWHDDPGARAVPCTKCLHYWKYDEKVGLGVCDAYPDGIPAKVMSELAMGEREECSSRFRYENNSNTELGLKYKKHRG